MPHPLHLPSLPVLDDAGHAFQASKASEEVPALLCAGGTFSEVEQVVTSTVEVGRAGCMPSKA